MSFRRRVSQPLLRVFLLTLLGPSGLALAADKSGTRPTAVSLPSGPGSVEGLGESFEANLNSGSVRYSVALKTPPGTAGMQPTLQLTYDSGGGNGPLGVGWALGVSSIQRRTDKGLPAYGVSDVWLLDGAELTQVSSGVYRLRNESRFVRVRKSGEHFEVDAPDGNTMRYGVSPESRLEAEGKTFAYLLETVVDKAGNRIGYFYQRDSNQLYLSRIEYNQRSGAANNRVDFVYESRPDNVSGFRSGFEVTTAKRLMEIKTFAAGKEVRRYALRYEMSETLSLLKSVTEFGVDGLALPTVSFTYTALPQNGRMQAMAQVPAAIPGPGSGDVELADMNGDGFADVLLTAQGAHTVSLNQGGLRFAASQALPSSPSVALGSSEVTLADMNGDGFTDLVAKLGNTVDAFRYFPGDGKGGWRPSETFTNAPDFAVGSANVRLVDFDRDGRVDAVQATSAGWYWYRNGGGGRWDAPVALPLPPGMTTISFDDARFQFGDFNGDRIADLVFVGNGSIAWWPGRGRGLFASPRQIQNAPEVGVNNEAGLSVADVTGDGISDIVYVGVNSLEVWPMHIDSALGTKRSVSIPYKNASVSVSRFADMNGNGTADIVILTPSAAQEERLAYVELVGDTKPNLLETASNGLGKKVTFRYSTSGLEFQEAAEKKVPWSMGLPLAVQVIKASKVSDSLGHEYVTEYTYRDGLFSAATREFRGFAQGKVRTLGDEKSPGNVMVYDFDLGLTHECLKGLTVKTTSLDESGKVYSVADTQYEARAYATGLLGEVVEAPLAVSKKTVLMEDSVPVSRSERFEYDGYGNVTRAESGVYFIGQTRQRGQEGRITKTSYAVNEGKWLLRFVANEVVENEKGERLAQTQTLYDGPAFEGLPLGQVETGFVTRTLSWVQGDRFIESSRVKRDEFGNVVETLTPKGLKRAFSFDATHTFVEKETVPLEAGGELTWQSRHELGTGNTLWTLSPNGEKAEAVYDSVGRVTAIVKPGASQEKPSVRFAYELASPTGVLRTTTALGGGKTSMQLNVFDGLGRKLRTAQQLGGRFLISGLTEYTQKGAVEKKWQGFWGASPEAAPPADTLTERYRYEPMGRWVERLRADGKVERAAHHSIAVDFFDADDSEPNHRNLPKTTVRSHLGKSVEVTERQKGKAEAVSRMEFDALGRPVKVTDPEGHSRSYAYDGLSRLTELVDGDLGKRSYSYDDNSNRLSVKWGLGEETTRYDGLDRPIESLAVSVLGAVESKQVFHYDSAVPGSAFDSKNYLGRVSSVEDDVGAEFMKYDERGRQVASRRVIDGRAFDMESQFDEGERVVGLTYPTGFQLGMQVDELGREVALSGIVNDVEYGAKSERTAVTYANGTREERRFDEIGRLSGAKLTAPGGVKRDSVYGYDNRGNVLTVSDRVNASLEAQYAYDDLSRLTSARVAEREFRYAYSDSGNLTQLNGEPVTYGQRPHAALQVGAENMDYGAAGELVKWRGKQGKYDARGKLREVSGPEGVTRYWYAANGELVKQEGPGGTFLFPSKYYEVTPQGEFLSAFLGQRRVVKFFEEKKAGCGCESGRGNAFGDALLWVVALLVASGLRRKQWAVLGAVVLALVSCVTPKASVGKATYLHVDNVNSVQFTSDEKGQVSEAFRYGPYGEALEAQKEIHSYGQKYADGASGLSFWNERQLDKTLGRWTSVDVDALENVEAHFASPQDLHVYLYGRGNPLRFEDMWGADNAEINAVRKRVEANAMPLTPQARVGLQELQAGFVAQQHENRWAYFKFNDMTLWDTVVMEFMELTGGISMGEAYTGATFREETALSTEERVFRGASGVWDAANAATTVVGVGVAAKAVAGAAKAAASRAVPVAVEEGVAVVRGVEVSAATVPKVNMGQQGKHLIGHNNYIEGRSVLTADPAKLAQKAGTGTPANAAPRGTPGFRERVDFGETIGDFVKDGVATPTSKGIIHHGKEGIHIVPAKP